jgi:SAM-dependent methyltransferase
VSSPIAKQQKSGVDRALINTHQRLSHGHRIDMLAKEFAERIRQVAVASPAAPVRVLDVGCGDMTLADAVAQELGNAELRCVDIHPCPAELLQADPRWQRYSTFDGRNLEFDNKAFDVVMFSDVLHHVPPALRTDLLASAGRVGHFVIVKDHFEYGWWSRQTLRAMDWVGNAGYGVSIPERYFDRAQWMRQCMDARLSVDRLDVGLRLYEHIPVLQVLLSSKWQFMSVCRAA